MNAIFRGDRRNKPSTRTRVLLWLQTREDAEEWFNVKQICKALNDVSSFKVRMALSSLISDEAVEATRAEGIRVYRLRED